MRKIIYANLEYSILYLIFYILDILWDIFNVPGKAQRYIEKEIEHGKILFPHRSVGILIE